MATERQHADEDQPQDEHPPAAVIATSTLAPDLDVAMRIISGPITIDIAAAYTAAYSVRHLDDLVLIDTSGTRGQTPQPQPHRAHLHPATPLTDMTSPIASSFDGGSIVIMPLGGCRVLDAP